MGPKELCLDEEFKKLQKDGKNTIDGLVKIMKDVKLIGDAAAEAAARKVMAANQEGKVTLENLTQALTGIAATSQKTAEEMVAAMRSALAAAAAPANARDADAKK